MAGHLVAMPGWPALWRVLLAYGFAARIPVLVIMFMAIFGGWDAHYAKPRPDFPAMGPWGLFFWTALLPELIPTGVGETRSIRCDRFKETLWWFWFPDVKRLPVIGSGPDRSRLCLCVPIDGGEPTPAGPGAFEWPAAIFPDGERIVAPGPDERLTIYETAGGAACRSGGHHRHLSGSRRKTPLRHRDA